MRTIRNERDSRRRILIARFKDTVTQASRPAIPTLACHVTFPLSSNCIMTVNGSQIPHQILVVDDEPDLELLVRQRFRKQIREKEFEFHFSHNGEEALQALEIRPNIDLVLSDINMPVMDGLTLLGKLNEGHKRLRAVVVSAYGDMPNIRTAMNRGAIDFLT